MKNLMEFLRYNVEVAPTRRFFALEVAHQFDILIDVVETLQLTLVVNDLHGVLNHLRRSRAEMITKY